MAQKHDFREPVFVKINDKTTIKASVIAWAEPIDGFSVKLSNGEVSVLVRSEDWANLVESINWELQRTKGDAA